MKQKLLNKIWLRTLAVVAVMTTAFAEQAWGETVTMRYQGTTTGNFGTGNEAATVGLDASQWSVIADKGNASNNVGFNKAGDIRLYYNAEGSNTLTVSSLTESTINSIKITFTGDDYSNVTVTVDGEAVTATDGVYAINSTSFVLGNGNTSNVQVRIASVLIDYTPSGINPVCTTPTISGEDQFLESTEVSITCSTEGATIKYSTNNGSSWTNYSAPFTLTATTTVLAKATKNGMNDSEVASKTFTKAEILTVAQARDAIDEAGGEKVLGVYAKGIVSTIVTPYSSEHGNVTFNLVDNTGDEVFLQAYRCGGDDASKVMIGDEVVVFGDLTKYKDTYEFAQGCEIVSLIHVEHQAYTLTIGTLENIELFIFNDPNGTELIESGAQIPWGTTIYISPDPDEGYLLDAITVTDASNENIVLMNAGAGMWSFVMPESDVTINASVTAKPASPKYTWVLADLADLTEDDVFVIVGNNDENYAMSNDKGTTTGPSAVAVTVEDGQITSNVSDNLLWTVSSSSSGYTFYPNGDTEKWLYCTNSNNGVRVGTNDNKLFVIKDGYLYHIATKRYVGLYNSADWRCYTLGTENAFPKNIEGQSFAFYKRVPVSVTIGEAGWASVVTPAAVAMPEGVTGYIVTDAANGSAKLAEVSAVPANTPILVQGAAGTYTFNEATTTDPVTGNKLLASDGSIVGDAATIYVLSTGNSGVGFYLLASGTKVPANKCYLQVRSGARSFIGFGDETAISTMNHQPSTIHHYDLQGRRVLQPTKGLYIVNGKKVVIK